MKPLAWVCAVVGLSMVPVQDRVAGTPGAGLEATVRTFLAAIDRGDATAAMTCLAESDAPFPASVFHVDMENQPQSFRGAEAMRAMVQRMMQAFAADQIERSTRVLHLAVHAPTPDLGACVVEFEQRYTARGNGKEGVARTFPYRASILAQQDPRGQWRIVHWHASLARPMPLAGRVPGRDEGR